MSDLQAFVFAVLCIAIMGFFAGMDHEMDEATKQDRTRIMAQMNNINNGE